MCIRDSLQAEYAVWTDKLRLLRMSRAIQTDPTIIFKLEKDIQATEQQWQALTREINQLEQQLALAPNRTMPNALPETPRPDQLRIWNLPFAHNPYFTGRDPELIQLHAQLQQSNTAAIGQTRSISGLGGIGKTQLALEYAYCYHLGYLLSACRVPTFGSYRAQTPRLFRPKEACSSEARLCWQNWNCWRRPS